MPGGARRDRGTAPGPSQQKGRELMSEQGPPAIERPPDPSPEVGARPSPEPLGQADDAEVGDDRRDIDEVDDAEPDDTVSGMPPEGAADDPYAPGAGTYSYTGSDIPYASLSALQERSFGKADDRPASPAPMPTAQASRGSMAETKIGLWGSPASGKTTYLAALRHAVSQSDSTSGRWNI